MSKRVKLSDIAIKIVNASMNEKRPYRPTTLDMQQRYRLNEQQVAKVKQHAKQYAASKGVLWAYNPGTNRYMICPADQSVTAKEMLDYAFRQWRSAGKSIHFLVKGAGGSRFITKKNVSTVTNGIDEVNLSIAEVHDKLKFRRYRQS